MLAPATIFASLYKAGVNTVRHDGVEHAGNLAFLGLLALFPFLVMVAALAGFMAEGQTGARFITLVLAELPPDMVEALRPRIQEIISGPPQGLLTVAILGALWTSSSTLEAYRAVLNRAYEVANPPAYHWRRLLSIAQTLVLTFMVIAAMMVLVLLPMAWGKLASALGKSAGPVSAHHIIVLSLVLIFAGICAAYYFLPNLKQRAVAVVPGAALVTCLWLEAAHLLTLYLAHFSQLDLIYGSLGGVIAALLFFFVNNLIFIYGAEFNHLLKVAASAIPAPQTPVPETARR